MANEVVINVKVDSGDAEVSVDRVKQKFDGLRQNVRRAGLALTAFGAAGGIAIREALVAALDQERATRLLQIAISNTGRAYSAWKIGIDKVTASLKEATGVGVGEQEKALARLVTVLGRVDLALLALPAAIDVAAASGQSLEAITDDVGRALSGQTDTIRSLGIEFDKSAGFSSRLNEILKRVGGTAEETVTPMTRLSTALSDTMAAGARPLLDVLNPIAGVLASMLDNLNELNPALAGVVGSFLAVSVAVAAVAGPIALLVGTGMLAAMGAGFVAILAVLVPLLPIILGIAAAVAALVLIFQTDFLGIGTFIKDAFSGLLDFLGEFWERLKKDPAEALGFLLGSLLRFFVQLPGRLIGAVRGAMGNIITFMAEGLMALGPAFENGLREMLPRLAQAVGSFFKGLLEGVGMALPSAALAPLKATAGLLAGLLSKIPDFLRPPGFSGLLESLEGFAALQHGGVVKRPTFALLGEAGPEAVVPLNRAPALAAIGAAGGGGGVVVNFYGPVYGLSDFQHEVTRAVRNALANGGFHGLIQR